MFLGTQGDLFTGVNYNGYSSPPGFNFNAGRENRIKVITRNMLFNLCMIYYSVSLELLFIFKLNIIYF